MIYPHINAELVATMASIGDIPFSKNHPPDAVTIKQ